MFLNFFETKQIHIRAYIYIEREKHDQFSYTLTKYILFFVFYYKEKKYDVFVCCERKISTFILLVVYL